MEGFVPIELDPIQEDNAESHWVTESSETGSESRARSIHVLIRRHARAAYSQEAPAQDDKTFCGLRGIWIDYIWPKSVEGYVPWLGPERVLYLFFFVMAVVLPSFIILSFSLTVLVTIARKDHTLTGTFSTLDIIIFLHLLYFTDFYCVMLAVLLLSVIWAQLRKLSRIGNSAFWVSSTPTLVLVVLLLACVMFTYFRQPSPWIMISLPSISTTCNARVSPQQLPLFEESVYQSQFARILDRNKYSDDQIVPFNQTSFLSVQSNETLSYQGFEGNGDFYGLGIRIGIYLQWIGSMLANNLIPQKRRQIQNVYIGLSLAICVATIAQSFGSAV